MPTTGWVRRRSRFARQQPPKICRMPHSPVSRSSFLNVAGDDQLLAAVRRCWASLWTARAISYRARHQIAPDTVSLAVVVQELIDADSSGIVFTADPVTGDDSMIEINAAWGLGETIVGGQVSPDMVTVERSSRSSHAYRDQYQDDHDATCAEWHYRRTGTD